MAELTMVQALNVALADAMQADERVVVFGEDVGRQGGVFRVTEGIQKRFGSERCFDTPLAESAIVGASVGMAIRGFRPVPEIQFDGFTYPAFDQIVTHLAKYQNRSHGLDDAGDHPGPLFRGHRVPRAPLRVDRDLLGALRWPQGCCSCRVPADADPLLRDSIECDDPVVVPRTQTALLDQGRGRSGRHAQEPHSAKQWFGGPGRTSPWSPTVGW